MENNVDNKVNLKLTDMPEWYQLWRKYIEEEKEKLRELALKKKPSDLEKKTRD